MRETRINRETDEELTAFDNLIAYLGLPLAGFTDHVTEIYMNAEAFLEDADNWENIYIAMMKPAWDYAERALAERIANAYQAVAEKFNAQNDIADVHDWADQTADWIGLEMCGNGEEPLKFSENLDRRLQETVARTIKEDLGILEYE